MINQKTATLVADVERAVSFVPRDRDDEIHELVKALNGALASQDEGALRRIAGEIADHAENRYEAVIAQADRLVRHLDEGV